MIDQRIIEDALACAMSTGGDFAELYAENTIGQTLFFVDGRIDRISDNTGSGVGIRVFLGQRTVYATTTDLTREGLLKCARNAATALGELKANISVRLTPTAVNNIHKIKLHPINAAMSERADILRSACVAARAFMLYGIRSAKRPVCSCP